MLFKKGIFTGTQQDNYCVLIINTRIVDLYSVTKKKKCALFNVEYFEN